MTPDQARRLLDGTTPGPWFFDDDMDGRVRTIGPIVPSGTELDCTTDDASLAAHAPDMAAMIAGMRTEWRAELQGAEGGWHVLPDHKGREWGGREWAEAAAENWRNDGFRVRLVPRYIAEPEEA